MTKWKLSISSEEVNFMEDIFTIANKNFNSRLIVGTGKYKNFEETASVVKESGADKVTDSDRRVNQPLDYQWPCPNCPLAHRRRVSLVWTRMP